MLHFWQHVQLALANVSLGAAVDCRSFIGRGVDILRERDGSKASGKVKVILDLEIKPRSLSHRGAWAVIANLSSVPIWVERLTFQAEEFGDRGKLVPLDVGHTIDAGKDGGIECHQSIYDAFEQITRGCDLHVGEVELTAHIPPNGKAIKRRQAYHLTSSRYGVQDVAEAASRMRRLFERLKVRYLLSRLGRG